MSKTTIIAMVNQKGGVGKTTSAVNLAASLGQLGKKILLIDLDPQGNATDGYGIDKESISITVKDVILDYQLNVRTAIMPTGVKGVDIIPANIELADIDLELINETKREERLKLALRPIKDNYDFIIIDCSPSLGLLTINALTCATDVFVPIDASYYAFGGVKQLFKTLNKVKYLLNDDISLSGVFITMADKRETLAKETIERAKQLFPDAVFKTIIRRNTKLRESPGSGKPVCLYDPNSYGAEDYLSLAKEVLERFGNEQ